MEQDELVERLGRIERSLGALHDELNILALGLAVFLAVILWRAW